MYYNSIIAIFDVKIVFFRIEIFANYIDLKLDPGKGLFQYEVKYSPDIDSIGLRRKLLAQHSASLGRTRTFDGMILYLPTKLPQNVSLNFGLKCYLILSYD